MEEKIKNYKEKLGMLETVNGICFGVSLLLSSIGGMVFGLLFGFSIASNNGINISPLMLYGIGMIIIGLVFLIGVYNITGSLRTKYKTQIKLQKRNKEK